MSDLRLERIFGRKDLLVSLDECRERVLNGELDLVSIIEIGSDGNHRFNTSWVDDMQFRWSRLVAALDDLRHQLLVDGLPDELK